MAATAAAAGIHQPDHATMAGAGDGKDSIKEMRQHLADELAAVRDLRRRVEDRLHTHAADQQTLVSSLQTLVPGLASSLDLSLRLVSAFNARPPPPSAAAAATAASEPAAVPVLHKDDPATSPKPYDIPASDPTPAAADAGDDPTLLVRSMVAVCLLERVPFAPIDSAAVLRKLEADASATAAERAALLQLGGEAGAIAAVEAVLRAIAEDTGAVELEDFGVSGKSRVLVFDIDRSRLVKELPESRGGSAAVGDGVGVPRPPPVPAATAPEMWASATPPMFPGPGAARPRMMGMMGMPPRGGAMVAPSPMHRPSSVLPAPAPAAGPNSGRLRTEEDDMKDLEALLNKKSFREMQKSKQGEELLDLIHRPTAKETAVAAKFKTKGGSQVKEYCSALTKEDCRRQSGSYIACEKVHFRRIIAPHTDVNLGDCSFLDTCRHMKTCKYVHYELDPTPDVPLMMGAQSLPPPKPIKPQRAEYCSEVELGEPQWINCDIRNFRMDILGQFGVIMADPPWDIHMELPYGTMADDEMRTLNVPALQTDGLIFLWVTGRAMELGRECLELWGYKRVEEIIWVKTNQLQRIIRTGRTGHWLNHSKEHCLVGIKGNPVVNRNIDTDVIVAEVRETSRKPDEMYPMLERISPRTRKLELFARMHNTHAGWMSLGNQLNGVRLVDEGLRARFKAAYPDVEVQPSSPQRPSSMDVDSGPVSQMRSPFASGAKTSTPSESFAGGEKPISADVEMAG